MSDLEKLRRDEFRARFTLCLVAAAALFVIAVVEESLRLQMPGL